MRKFGTEVASREAREGWPCRTTVETEVDGDSKRKMKGVIPQLACQACRASTRKFLFCHGCSSRTSKNVFFLIIQYFNSLVPIAQQAGQASMLSRLFFSICLWLLQYFVYVQLHRIYLILCVQL
jgi:hypothetical protein